MKKKRKQKSHDKKHRQAASIPETHVLFEALRRDWYNINAVERGDRVIRLLEKNCTRRGLAKDLHVDDQTIRKAISAAELPGINRKMIEGGVSAKRVLKAAHKKTSSESTQQREEQEKQEQRATKKLELFKEVLEAKKGEKGKNKPLF